jgi:hypothetical protein
MARTRIPRLELKLETHGMTQNSIVQPGSERHQEETDRLSINLKGKIV